MGDAHNDTGIELAKVLCEQTNWPLKPVSAFFCSITHSFRMLVRSENSHSKIIRSHFICLYLFVLEVKLVARMCSSHLEEGRACPTPELTGKIIFHSIFVSLYEVQGELL